MTATAAPYAILRRSAFATGAVFALSGGLWATWVSRLPEVRTRLHADTGSLGIALLGSAIGSILSTPLTGILVRRYGSRAVITAACGISSGALIGLGLVRSVVQLGLVLAVFGVGYGSWDVAMNVHGHAVESAAGRAWMPRYHAAWSVGGFVLAGLGSLISAVRVPVIAHFTAVSCVTVACVCALLLLFLPDRESAEDRIRHAAHAHPILTWRLAALGVVMACATLIEGAASDWLGIYFDDVRGVAPAAGAAAFTTFAVAMAASRGAGTWTIAVLGRGRAVRLSGLLALVGVALLLLSPVTGGAYVGAALWGLGTAIVFPAVISAAGDSSRRPADAIALVTPMGYSGFLFGPPLIGLLAHSFGLERALWTVGALAAVMVALAGATRERG